MIEERLRQLELRWGRWFAYAAIAIGVSLTVFALTRQEWVMSDGLIYQEAAQRLRDGDPLYVPAEIGERSYRYSPWFAFVWMAVPIPEAIWLLAMTICAIASVIPALRSGWWGISIGALVFPYLLIAAMGGHVQPAIIAALVYGVRTPWGPAAIAIAASLKLTPILYVLVYLARRQWREAMLALLLTAALVLPILLFDLTYFPTDTVGSWGLFEWSPVLWAVVVSVLGAFVWVRPSWFGASVLAMLAIPKFVYYDVSYLLVGIDDRTDHDLSSNGPVADSD